jgi:hypothetical protein
MRVPVLGSVALGWQSKSTEIPRWTMKKRSFGIVFGLIMFLSACGSDSSPDKGKTTSASTATKKDGTIPCAQATCTLPDSLKGETLCCMDKFNGGCGIMAGSSCRAFPTVDSRCPVPDLMASAGQGMMFDIKAFGCCASNNECGIDFGMGGCQPTTSLCRYISKDEAASLKPTTCDGAAVEVPANCGQNGRPMFPGAAGSGAAAGSGS